MSMTQVLEQILIIFCYVIVGFVSGKIGIINSEERMFLSKLCSSMILPFTILSAASMSVGSGEFLNLGIALVVDSLVLGGTGTVCKICSAFHDPVCCQPSHRDRTGTMFSIVSLVKSFQTDLGR